MAIILSQHLRTALDRKRLKMAYIEAAIAAPDWTPSQTDAGLV
jgi:hypothetical protein